VSVDEAAQLLGISRPTAERHCSVLVPYICADGTLKWPLREVAKLHANVGGARTRW
jgi:hypothetical protein